MQRHRLRCCVVGVAEESDIGLAIVAAHHEALHPLRVAARVEDAEGTTGTALHLCDQHLFIERRDVAVEHDVAHLRTRTCRDVHDHVGATERALELRFRIDGRFEIADTIEILLDRSGAAIDGVERQDVADVHRHLALRALAFFAV